jgi:hypothetical protein
VANYDFEARSIRRLAASCGHRAWATECPKPADRALRYDMGAMLPCTFTLLTPLSIVRKEFGKKLLTSILKHFPDHVPRVYGDVEPLRRRFDAEQLDVALECWGHRVFMTQRKESQASMMVSFQNASKFNHSSVAYFNFPLAGIHELPSLRLLLHELSEAFAADYAMAHILTRHELSERMLQIAQRVTSWPEPPIETIMARMRRRVDREGYARVLWGLEALKVNTHQLQQCLPNLFWLNVFGPPYTNLFGLKRLMDAPCNAVDQLPYGGVSLTLTRSLVDDPLEWNAYSAARERCKSHLGADAFCGRSVSKDYPYLTPHFEHGMAS